ncbi:MAG: hypothetical protein V1676_07030 [Candidatus Diapherotrites archaeon]
MKLGLIVNCVGYDRNCVPINVHLLKHISPRLGQLGIEYSLVMPSSDWIGTKLTKHTDFLPSQDPEEVARILRSANNKGVVVRGCIAEFAKDGLDCVLHIDGSGKFDLGDIVRVIEIILDASVDAILTKRDKSGMNKFRTLLEKLEMELVSRKFNNALIEDGQCGCWCIRLGNKDCDLQKELTATGYEIELDILISQLKYGRNIVWLPIKITDTKKSKYTFGANILKMEWLSGKLGLRKSEALSFMREFQSKNGGEIRDAEDESEKLGDAENKFDNYVQKIEESTKFIG